MKITSILGLSLMISSVSMAQQVDRKPVRDTAQELETIQVTAAAPSVKPSIAITNTQLLQEVPASLSLQPSVFITSDGGSGFGYTYLYVRGMDQTRLAVTLNGMPFADPEDQGFYSSNIPNLLGSTRLSLTPGIAGSSGGVVGLAGQMDLTTPNPYLLKPGMEGVLGFGSFGTRQTSLNMTTNSAYLNLTSQQSDGYKYGAYEEGKSAIGGFNHLFNSWIIRGTGLFGDVRHGSAWDAQPLSVATFNGRTNDINGFGEHFREIVGQLQAQRNLGNNDKLSITLMGNWIRGSYDVATGPTIDLAVNQQWLQSAAAWTHNDIFSAGMLISEDNRTHSSFIKDVPELLYSNSGQKGEFTTWVRGNINWIGLTLTPEVQLRDVTFSYVPSVTGGTFNPQNWIFINPKLTIARSLTSHLTARINLAYTNREPSRSDLFAGADDLDPILSVSLRANPVKPEALISTEAGMLYSTSKVLFNVNVYNMAFHNQIMPNGPLSISGIPLRQNVPTSYRRGIEVDGKFQILSTLAIGLSGAIEDARIGIWNDATTGERAINTVALLTPPFIAHASIEKKFSCITFSYVHTERGSMFLSNMEYPINRLSQTRWDDISVRISPSNDNTTVKFSISNLGNAFITTGGYAGATEPYVYVMARRSFNITITLR